MKNEIQNAQNLQLKIQQAHDKTSALMAEQKKALTGLAAMVNAPAKAATKVEASSFDAIKKVHKTGGQKLWK